MQALPVADAIHLTSYAEVREALLTRELREAGHDEADYFLERHILTLHGEEHTTRRRVENRLFRREALRYFEHSLRDSIAATVERHVRDGRADLVELAHRLVAHTATLISGTDRPRGTPEEADRLFYFLMKFSEGATILDSTRDKAELRAEVVAALRKFEVDYFKPSLVRRQALLARYEAGQIGPDELPHDMLMHLLRYQRELGLTDEDLLRIEASYYTATFHTSAKQIVQLLHELFGWCAAHPDQAALPATDLGFLQRAMHESARLHPLPHYALRQAPDRPIRLRGGREIAPLAYVCCDLGAANRDPAVFGPDPARFRPGRTLPPGVPTWGLSFGAGMHACIGTELATGKGDEPADGQEARFGTITRAVRALLDLGIAPDPARPPVPATHTRRPEWGSYPVIFRARAASQA